MTSQKSVKSTEVITTKSTKGEKSVSMHVKACTLAAHVSSGLRNDGSKKRSRVNGWVNTAAQLPFRNY